MYSIEGKIATRLNPDTLIGRHGAFYISKHSVEGLYGTEITTIKKYATGSKDRIEGEVESWCAQGDASELITLELITTREQAEKYATRRQASRIKMESSERPQLQLALRQIAPPEDEEVVEGYVELWRDRRFPSPAVWLLAIGELLDVAEFHPEVGWHNPYLEVTGERKKTGLVTPIYQSKIRTKTHTLFKK